MKCSPQLHPPERGALRLLETAPSQGREWTRKASGMLWPGGRRTFGALWTLSCHGQPRTSTGMACVAEHTTGKKLGVLKEQRRMHNRRLVFHTSTPALAFEGTREVRLSPRTDCRKKTNESTHELGRELASLHVFSVAVRALTPLLLLLLCVWFFNTSDWHGTSACPKILSAGGTAWCC